jgi:hypothetical protein
MKIRKCALIALLGLPVYGLSALAHADDAALRTPGAFSIPATAASAGTVVVSVDDATGAVRYLSADGAWDPAERVTRLAGQPDAIVQKAFWYEDGGGCNCVGAPPPPPPYYFNNGYLYGGAYRGAPYYPPAKTYRREEHHIYEYRNVRPVAPPPQPYPYPYYLPPGPPPGPYYGD